MEHHTLTTQRKNITQLQYQPGNIRRQISHPASNKSPRQVVRTEPNLTKLKFASITPR
jgi:hypothetical protein